MASRSDYLPFGQELPITWGNRADYSPDASETLKFTGKERDQETGLDFFEARYFSSAQGRFTSPDEFKGGIVDPFTGLDIETNTALPYADITDPQTLNKYGYVRNSPLRYVDPDGHALGLDDLVGTVRGALVGVGTEVARSRGAQLSPHLQLSNTSVWLCTVNDARQNLHQFMPYRRFVCETK